VVAHAKKGKVAMTRTVQNDAQSLGYSSPDVHACIAALVPADFSKTVDYEGCKYDVYLPRYRGPSGAIDALYVKLSKPETTVGQVVLMRFHLQR
jgi:hypothetical protein